MVKLPPAAPVAQVGLVYQDTVPVELLAAVNACPPAPALRGFPEGSCSCTVIALAAPAHCPAAKVWEPVVKTSFGAGFQVKGNAVDGRKSVEVAVSESPPLLAREA